MSTLQERQINEEKHEEQQQSTQRQTTRTGNRHISADVIGPFTRSITGAAYMLVIVCMKTKYMYVRSIKGQQDMHDKFEEYRMTMIAKDAHCNRVHLNISKLCTDHAQNLMSEEMKIWR
jgi:hypothetical protein